MASTQYDLPSLEASWFRNPRPVPPSGQFHDLPQARPLDARRARRRRLVKGLGCAFIAGLSVCAVWMMATSTAASDVIESWGTMGNVAQARLTPTPGELAAPSEPELTLGAGTIAWAVEPPVAESSQPAVAVAEAPAPAVWHASARASDDPYADVRPAAAPQGALNDPY
jgi:hypothetical protein